MREFMEKSKRILIIEDNEASLQYIKTHLEHQGYETIPVQNGYEGLRQVRVERPDLILLDLLLPDLDGHKLCRMIKFDKNLGHIPVAVWTSRDTEEYAEKAKACGADAYIVKMTRIEIVLDIIKKLLEIAEKGSKKKNQEISDKEH
jgi:DNA-binding response OmpR family regulator